MRMLSIKSTLQGIQWATALCDGPPVLAILDLLWTLLVHPTIGNNECIKTSLNSHCILKS